MPDWKILLTDGLEENGLEILRREANVTDLPDISKDGLLKVIGDYDGVIVRGRTKLTSEVFDAAGKLKAAGRAGVGVDNIDLDAAREHHVTVINTPLAPSIAVAELTIGLMLSVARNIPYANQGMKQGKWLKKELVGTELHGKTLGVIGYGRIGSQVAIRAKAFGMNIIGVAVPPDPEGFAKIGGLDVTVDEVYRQSDIITIHTPLLKETRGMINKSVFDRLKDGVVIICAARGGVIDEDSLLEALETGKVAGAALDVFATEPPGDSPLACHPRVVCTPHIGAQTIEAQEQAAVDIATEMLNALQDKPLRWKVF